MSVYIEQSLFQFCIFLLKLLNLSLDPILFQASHDTFFILLFFITFWNFGIKVSILFIQNILKLILQIDFIIKIRFELISLVFKSLIISFFKLWAHLQRRLHRHTVSSILIILFLRYLLGCYNLSWWIFVYIFWNLQLFINQI